MKIKRERRKIWKILLIILVILILLVGGFFGVKAYKTWRGNKDISIFKNGYQYGYGYAVLQVINLSLECKPFPIYLGNQTANLISVDCLQRVQ